MSVQTFDNLIGLPHFRTKMDWNFLCKFSVAELADKHSPLMM